MGGRRDGDGECCAIGDRHERKMKIERPLQIKPKWECLFGEFRRQLIVNLLFPLCLPRGLFSDLPFTLEAFGERGVSSPVRKVCPVGFLYFVWSKLVQLKRHCFAYHSCFTTVQLNLP